MSRENKITYYGDSDDDCSSESDMEEVLPKSCADDLLAQCLAKTDNNVLTHTSEILFSIDVIKKKKCIYIYVRYFLDSKL